MNAESDNTGMTNRVDQFVSCIKSGDIPGATEIIDRDSTIADSQTGNGVSLLMLAMYFRQNVLAEKIASKKEQSLTIHEAAAIGDSCQVKKILSAGHDHIKQFSNDGFTALHLAAFFDHPGVARILLANGADCDQPTANEQKICPLHSAAASRSERMVRILLAAGADPNLQQTGGFTALHSAAKHGDLLMTQSLLGNGADANIKTDDGKTAYDFAKEENHEHVANVIQQRVFG